MANGRSRRPIRIFWSPFSRRLYASAHYREDGDGVVTITGERFDVTSEIAGLIEEHKITFVKRGLGQDREAPR